jgi:oligopeptide transport system ATP-binding protein
MSRILDVNDLKVSFFTPVGEVKAVNGISYHIDKGEVLGVVGESGSGKSVSAYSLIGLISNPGRVIGGKITFDGKDVLAMNKEEKRALRGKEIAMIFQDPMTCLNPLYTIGNQIKEALALYFNMKGAAADKRAEELLTLVGINDPKRRLKQYPFEFSGGMRQRAMIAMALAGDPKLLIADEPTTALDVTIQAQILELLKDIKNRINMSVMIITHDLGVVADFADRVVTMYGGKIVETGATERLFKNPSHPYTQGLLGSLPKLNSDGGKLTSIEGSPIDLLNPPKGCPFAPRCSKCMKVCLNNMPSMFHIENGHECACWLKHKYADEKGVKA